MVHRPPAATVHQPATHPDLTKVTYVGLVVCREICGYGIMRISNAVKFIWEPNPKSTNLSPLPSSISQHALACDRRRNGRPVPNAVMRISSLLVFCSWQKMLWILSPFGVGGHQFFLLSYYLYVLIVARPSNSKTNGHTLSCSESLTLA